MASTGTETVLKHDRKADDKIARKTPEGTNNHGVLHDDEEEKIAGETSEWEKNRILAGETKFNRLGWKRLTIILIVEAVALGALSIPAAFATLGMIAGVICCVLFGFIAIAAGYNVGYTKVKYPQVQNFADAARLMFGKWGAEFVWIVFGLELIFVSGSHCLTGTIAFQNLTDDGACSLVFGVVSAIILLGVSIPPTFTEMAILGYIDCVSILSAIGVTIIATGIQSTNAAGGLSSVNWSAYPKENVTVSEIFVAIVNIILAYTFTLCQFSFMDEMHTPEDFGKSVWLAGIAEMIIYTVTGATVYAFVGVDVQSPALLSAGPLVSKVAFGLAIPVIFISGAIITQVAARLIHGRIYKHDVARYVNTKKGWITWLITLVVVVFVGWVIAEAIPFFSDLVALISSLFNSGFALYLPALMWFFLLREGPWNSRENLIKGALNGFMFLLGMVVLVAGTYSAITDIVSTLLRQVRSVTITNISPRFHNIIKAQSVARLHAAPCNKLGCLSIIIICTFCIAMVHSI